MNSLDVLATFSADEIKQANTREYQNRLAEKAGLAYFQNYIRGIYYVTHLENNSINETFLMERDDNIYRFDMKSPCYNYIMQVARHPAERA